MTTAIGLVITDHIGAGRLQDQRLTGKLIRYPEDVEELDSLAAIPSSELVELLATLIAALSAIDPAPVDAIGVAVPGIIRNGVVEDFPGEAALEYGRVRADLKLRGEMIGANDLLIAAHAHCLGLTLVTNNTREFGRVRGLKLENWV